MSNLFRNTPARVADQNQMEIVSLFADLGLKITIQVFGRCPAERLSTKKYYPYRKPNDRPINVHPQTIQSSPNYIQLSENIPASINRRLTDISSSEQAFSYASPLMQNSDTL